jgi:hypothetical protein
MFDYLTTLAQLHGIAVNIVTRLRAGTQDFNSLQSRIFLKMAVSWVVAPYNLVEVLAAFIRVALMMEAASTSETSGNFYQTIRRYNPEDTRRRENLKSYHNIQIGSGATQPPVNGGSFLGGKAAGT